MAFIIENLPIVICAVVGIMFIIVEMFMPGFGIPGIAGGILLCISVVLTWRDHGPVAGLVATLVILSLSGLGVSASLKSVTSGRLSKSPLVLRDSESRQDGFVAGEDLQAFIGREGLTATVLRPAGIAIFDQVRLNVVSQGEFINKGVKVRISKVEGARVLVESC